MASRPIPSAHHQKQPPCQDGKSKPSAGNCGISGKTGRTVPGPARCGRRLAAELARQPGNSCLKTKSPHRAPTASYPAVQFLPVLCGSCRPAAQEFPGPGPGGGRHGHGYRGIHRAAGLARPLLMSQGRLDILLRQATAGSRGYAAGSRTLFPRTPSYSHGHPPTCAPRQDRALGGLMPGGGWPNFRDWGSVVDGEWIDRGGEAAWPGNASDRLALSAGAGFLIRVFRRLGVLMRLIG